MAPKNKKGQTFSLGEFASKVEEETGGKVAANWADEEIDLPSAPLGDGTLCVLVR